MKKRLYIIAGAIIFLIGLFSVISTAEETEEKTSNSISELKEQRRIAQEKISENTVKLDELQVEISDLMAEIQEVSDNIYKYEVEVAVLNKEIEELDVKIYEIELELTEAEKKYMRQKELLSNRIVAQYEAGDIVYLDFLLSSNSLTDFISSYYIIGEIAEIDNELLNSYKVQKEKVNQIKKELDEYKAELKNKKENQEKSAIVLSNIKVIKNNQMSRLSEQEQELQNKIDEYQKEVQEIEVELLIALTANIGEEYVGGQLAWPVPGFNSISSRFGMRIHPISGVYKLHSGVDLAAPGGAFFVAANDGTVVTSRYSASYGNVVVVDHGGGLSTLYAHGQARLVDVGDQVKKGEPVLKVGSTGISTGNHAHFEVRINGVCVDPLDYILKRNDA